MRDILAHKTCDATLFSHESLRCAAKRDAILWRFHSRDDVTSGSRGERRKFERSRSRTSSGRISLSGQLGRSTAYTVDKSDAFVYQGDRPSIFAEGINKYFRAKRYAAALRRYDPPVAGIPNKGVAAIFMSGDVYVGRVKRLAGQSDVADRFAQGRRQAGRKSNLDRSGRRRTVQGGGLREHRGDRHR